MTSSSVEPILYVEVDNVAWITLNRPEKLNSMTSVMAQQLQSIFSTISTSSKVRCVVLAGAGSAFCAGQDLSDIEGVDLGDLLEQDFNPLVRAIKNLNMPVIACVNGVAAGAGANLALACDLVLAAKSAKFIQSFANLGLVPDAGGTWMLPKLIGLARAKGLALTAEPVNAEQAEQWGMIWRCIDDNALMDETTALANQLANQATTGLAFTKLLMNDSSSKTLDEQLDLERDFQRAACNTDDYKEGVSAFINKRKPSFNGY